MCSAKQFCDGLLVQASNFGQLLGPAALAAWVEKFGWSSAPLLFAAIAAREAVADSGIVWTARISAVVAGLMTAALLAVLALFVDLLVSQGLLPAPG